MAPKQRPVARPAPKPKPATGTPKKQRPTRKKPEFSPEAKAKLSQLAKERHAAGKLGGSKFGKLGGRGNTKEKRLASATVADAAQKHSTEIIDVFRDAVAEGTPMTHRLKGAELWLKAEQENEKIAVTKQKAAAEHMSREELVRVIAEALSKGSTSAALQNALTPPPPQAPEWIPDATVVEDDA
jgi:hypothetical protein